MSERQAPDLSHIHPERHGCLTCLNPDCPIWQAADQNCWKSLAQHDAALIAQEREKREREHTPTFHAENPGVFNPWYNVEMVAARVRSAEKKAREDVLRELRIAIENGLPDQQHTLDRVYGFLQKKESLRHGQKQDR